jgi:hypothetical protein
LCLTHELTFGLNILRIVNIHSEPIETISERQYLFRGIFHSHRNTGSPISVLALCIFFDRLEREDHLQPTMRITVAHQVNTIFAICFP